MLLLETLGVRSTPDVYLCQGSNLFGRLIKLNQALQEFGGTTTSKFYSSAGWNVFAKLSEVSNGNFPETIVKFLLSNKSGWVSHRSGAVEFPSRVFFLRSYQAWYALLFLQEFSQC